jgi:hypothetical protein
MNGADAAPSRTFQTGPSVQCPYSGFVPKVKDKYQYEYAYCLLLLSPSLKKQDMSGLKILA